MKYHLFAHCVTHNEGIGKIGKEFLTQLDQTGKFKICLKTIKEFWLYQPPSPELKNRFLKMINNYLFTQSRNNSDRLDLHYTNLSFPFIDRSLDLPLIQETFWETDHLPDEWVIWSEDVDEFWLSTDFLISMFKKSGVNANKIRKIPFGINHPPIDSLKNLFKSSASSRTCRILFPGSFTYRKGIFFLIPAFVEEFDREDNIELILRISPFGYTLEKMNLLINKLNRSIVKRNRPRISLITKPLSEKDYWNLLFSCDAIISPTMGEGFNRPIAEAMIVGKPTIVTKIPPVTEYATDQTSYFIDHLGLVPVSNMESSGNFSEWFDEKYNHKWYMPSYDSIKRQMREFFEDFRSGELDAKIDFIKKKEFSKKWDWNNFMDLRLDRLEEFGGK